MWCDVCMDSETDRPDDSFVIFTVGSGDRTHQTFLRSSVEARALELYLRAKDSPRLVRIVGDGRTTVRRLGDRDPFSVSFGNLPDRFEEEAQRIADRAVEAGAIEVAAMPLM